MGKTVGSCVGGHLLCLPLLREVGLGVTGESPISIDVLGDDEGETKLGLSVVGKDVVGEDVNLFDVG